MPKPTLIASNEFKRTYRVHSGDIVRMTLDDQGYSYIKFFNKEGVEIGLFEFSEIENGDYKLMYMYLDTVDAKYKGQGLGKEALLFFKEMTDTNIYTSPNGGQTRPDGSHFNR